MATSSNSRSSGNSGGALGFEATLWAAADKLRGNLDAAEYNNGEESRTLAALRDAPLPKLLSGRLRVPAMEKLAEVKA